MGRGGPHRYSHLKTCPVVFLGLNIFDIFSERETHFLAGLLKESSRVISTAQLQPSLTLHLQPIYVIISDVPDTEVSSRGGFRA